MKKAIIILALIILLAPMAVLAYSVKTGDSVYLAKEEVLVGNLYAAGSNLTVEGKVDGDVICAGQSINITGEVTGDVICAGQSINISGNIGGNMRLAGNSINFSGQVARNAMTFGATIVTTASSTIGWDLLAAGNAFELRGDIGRDLYGGMAKANLAGKVGKNIKLNFGQQNNNGQPLTIAQTAEIDGDVNYTSNKNAVIEDGAIIKGATLHKLPETVVKKSNFIGLTWWWKNLIAIFSALVIGLVIISFWRETIVKITDLMSNKTSSAFGWGILALLLTPIIVFILLITVIGIPLALILLALWLIALCLSKVLVGILAGRWLLNKFLPQQKNSLILGMVIGIVIVHLLFAIPLLGWVLALLATLWGLGGIMLALRKT